VNPGITRPGKHEDTDWNKDTPQNSWRQSKFRLTVSFNARIVAQLADEFVPNIVPQGIKDSGEQHSHEDAKKRAAVLPEVEAVNIAEYKVKGPKEEIQNTEDNGCEDT
jgi:hypothetical protein